MIPSTVDKSKVESVGFMYHNQYENTLHCFEQDKIRSTEWGEPHVYNDFMNVVWLLKIALKIKEVDIISCNVVNAEQGTMLNTIGQSLKVKINASINPTGGSQGDWILEEGNVNLIGRYFNPKILKSGMVLLAFKNPKQTATPSPPVIDAKFINDGFRQFIQMYGTNPTNAQLQDAVKKAKAMGITTTTQQIKDGLKQYLATAAKK